jgi:N6-adenosine-specific RNA methylase IME4
MTRADDDRYPPSFMDSLPSCSDALKALTVPDLAADDCALFIWCTAPILPTAMQLIEAWGFVYRSTFVWVRADEYGRHANPGYWSKDQHSHLVIGTRGELSCPSRVAQLDSVQSDDFGCGSPESVLMMIEKQFPNLKRIELGCVRNRHGWATWLR